MTLSTIQLPEVSDGDTIHGFPPKSDWDVIGTEKPDTIRVRNQHTDERSEMSQSCLVGMRIRRTDD